MSHFYQNALAHFKPLQPGIVVCVTIGFAASFLSANYNVPVMIFALLLGIAFNFLNEDNSVCQQGIEFSSRTLLRVGIALLGLRITFDDIASLGIFPILIVISGVIMTILFSIILARIIQLPKRMGMMAGGSVAICGASAALAISSVMPDDKETKRITIFTVISVTTFSTVAMVVYPIITNALGLTTAQGGLFLGGTIHDVAQVVGAGYSISDDVGELSTFIKLLRVAMLIPVVLFLAAFVYRRASRDTAIKIDTKRIFPFFLLGFIFFVCVSSIEVLPSVAHSALSSLSSWLLVIAISALGVKTSLREIADVGWKPIALILSNTVFIALYILGAIYFFQAV